jgi:hypothetical protein
MAWHIVVCAFLAGAGHVFGYKSFHNPPTAQQSKSSKVLPCTQATNTAKKTISFGNTILSSQPVLLPGYPHGMPNVSLALYRQQQYISPNP